MCFSNSALRKISRKVFYYINTFLASYLEKAFRGGCQGVLHGFDVKIGALSAINHSSDGFLLRKKTNHGHTPMDEKL